MNKLKIFLTTFAICIMSVGFSFADSRITEERPYYVVYEAYGKKSSFSYAFAEYHSSGGIIFRNVDEIGNLGGYKIIFYDSKILETNDNSLKDIVEKNPIFPSDFLPSLISPPQIAPTIQGAIQGIVPTFSKQLLAFLPKALVIFSMVLSIPLIPRVIRLFF